MATQPQTLSPRAEPLAILPRHVAIIMDGNGRWAAARHLPRLAGHRAGTENIRRIIESCVELGIEVLTLYAFSTENWRRSGEEVNGLMSILAEVIDRETAQLHANDVRLQHIGRLDGLPSTLQERVRYAVELTRDNGRLVVNVAFNYGGRAEIVEAARRLIRDGVDPSELDEDRFAGYLYTGGMCDPDLIIRTAGEMRLSNFLLWQAAYAEYWTTPTYWPDFTNDGLVEAVREFGRRQRRFGSV